jgi:putative transposase
LVAEVGARFVSSNADTGKSFISGDLRPLDPVYPIVYLDCIVLKIRQDKQVINKSIFLALGVNLEGHKDAK